MLHTPAEAHSGPRQASNLDLFVRVVNVFRLTLLTIFGKGSIIDHCVRPVRIRSYSGPYFPTFGLNTDQNKTLFQTKFIKIRE